jgi:hypothetical protein
VSDIEFSVVGELRDWRKHVCRSDGAYVLWGFIYDDSRNRFPDGQWVHTSRVKNIVGDLAYTHTGSIYRLIGFAAGEAVNIWA